MSDDTGSPERPIEQNPSQNNPTPSPQPPKSEQDELHERLIFEQDLNEVHLLIDFVSGRADRNLASLTMPNPLRATPQDSETLSAAEVVRRIAEMRYPPDPKTPAMNAKNAALLLMAKDRLSQLADPARGFTIAYTTMFVGVESEKRHRSRFGAVIRRWLTGPLPNPPPAAGAARGRHNNQPDSRFDLAKETFPALEPHVRRFVHWRDWAIRFAVVWLVLTALTSWDVGHGRSVLDRLDQNWKARAAELQTFPELADPSLCKLHEPGETNLSITPAPPKDPKTGEAKLPDQKTLDEIKRLAPHCARLWNLDKSREDSRADLDRVFLCSDMHWFVKPLHIWCWSDILAGSVEPPRPEELTEKPKTPRVHWQSATSILSVFTTYILPMMFGLLGTLIGAFRSIINRIRDSELAPRDFAGMKLGIPMGLVAGIAVGLFFSPSSVPVQGSGAVAGDLTLTASGLGFLAGYASQTFFHFIDDLLKRVFPDSGAAAPPSTAASTHVIVRSPAAPPAQQPGEGQQAGGQQPGGGHAD